MITITMSQLADGTNIAQTAWNGQIFRAETHGGATHEVARQLVTAGAADQPWRAVRGSMVCLTGRSLYRWAELMTADNDTGLRTAKWSNPRAIFCGTDKAA